MVVACVAAAGGGALPAGAAADQTVVSATIFPGTAGNHSTQPVLLSTLATDPCATYDGPLWNYPDGQGPLTTGTVWSLSEIISCGLGTTQSDVTAVKVFNGDTNAYETTLTPDEVFNADSYPSGAIPLISVDGSPTSGGPVTYTRPPTGPTDPAQSDQFTEDGTTPVSIEVYENQLPLNITPAPAYGASNASSQAVTLAATVTGADGAAIDPSQLTWSWTFAGASAGTTATPAVSVAAGDSVLVSVIAEDPATGASGTATFNVAYTPSPTPPAQTPDPGAGTSPKGAPVGSANGKPDSHGKRKLKHSGALTHAGANPGAGATTTATGSGPRPGRHSPAPRQTNTATTPATTPPASNPALPPAVPPAAPPALPPTIQTTTVTTPSPTTNPGLTVVTSPTKVPQRKRTHAPRRRSAAQPGSPQRQVTGRLVADVQALPEDESSLVHPIAAQAAAAALVHSAGDGTSAPTWAYAAIAVLALLCGGALYERRGRRGRTLHR